MISAGGIRNSAEKTFGPKPFAILFANYDWISAIKSLSLTAQPTPEKTGSVTDTRLVLPTFAKAASSIAASLPSGENSTWEREQNVSMGISPTSGKD